jgi:hypothetical protein
VIDLHQCKTGDFASKPAALKMDKAMPEATALRAKAEGFRHLAEFIINKAAREELLTLASEFDADAVEIEARSSGKSPD